MNEKVWIGTSGWVYPHWRGAFYPEGLPQARWFAYYAERFSTVEINNTFYRLPVESTWAKWHAQAPPGFIYALKASRTITHVKRLKDCGAALERFFAGARLLGEHLGPVLYQLPPRWRPDLARLADFLRALPPGYTHVLEARDPRWLVEPVFRLLERHGVGFCIVSAPGLDCPLRATASAVYVRMHGQRIWYGDRYTRDELRAWARHLRAFLAQGHQVYVYFNNDACGYAIQNALELRALLQSEAP